VQYNIEHIMQYSIELYTILYIILYIIIYHAAFRLTSTFADLSEGQMRTWPYGPQGTLEYPAGACKVCGERTTLLCQSGSLLPLAFAAESIE